MSVLEVADNSIGVDDTARVFDGEGSTMSVGVEVDETSEDVAVDVGETEGGVRLGDDVG